MGCCRGPGCRVRPSQSLGEGLASLAHIRDALLPCFCRFGQAVSITALMPLSRLRQASGLAWPGGGAAVRSASRPHLKFSLGTHACLPAHSARRAWAFLGAADGGCFPCVVAGRQLSSRPPPGPATEVTGFAAAVVLCPSHRTQASPEPAIGSQSPGWSRERGCLPSLLSAPVTATCVKTYGVRCRAPPVGPT